MDWAKESERLRNEKGLGGYVPLDPFVSERKTEQALWYEKQLVVKYAQGAEVGNACCAWEGNIPADVGPPPHIHFYEHEFFYVLNGGIRAWVEGIEHEVGENSLLFLPCGRMHWFVATSDDTRMLAFTVTAAPEFPRINRSTDLFSFIGQAAGDLVMPPPGLEDNIPEPEEILALTHELGSEFPQLLDAGWRRGFGDSDKRE